MYALIFMLIVWAIVILAQQEIAFRRILRQYDEIINRRKPF